MRPLAMPSFRAIRTTFGRRKRVCCSSAQHELVDVCRSGEHPLHQVGSSASEPLLSVRVITTNVGKPVRCFSACERIATPACEKMASAMVSSDSCGRL